MQPSDGSGIIAACKPMPDFLFNPKDGFEGPDVPEVDAPAPQHVNLTARSRAPRELPWVFTFIGYILLATIGAAAALIALLALRVA
jgi:hypothetical protein